MSTDNHEDIQRSGPEGAATPVTVVQKAYRWTFGAVVAQMLFLAMVATVAFGGGYAFRENQGLSTYQDLMEQRVQAVEEIAALRTEMLELKLAGAERDVRRATVVEVDLSAVLTPLRESVVIAADALAERMAAEISQTTGEVPLEDVLEAALLIEDQVAAQATALLTAEEPEGDEVLIETEVEPAGGALPAGQPVEPVEHAPTAPNFLAIEPQSPIGGFEDERDDADQNP